MTTPVAIAAKPPAWQSFAISGLAAMTAAAATHPLDTLKVRLQLQGELPSTAVRRGLVAETISILKTQGIPGLYPGLTASLFRQATYSMTRLGVYQELKDVLVARAGTDNISFGLKLFAGVTGGTLGAIVGTPADVMLVRMQADGRLPAEQRRGYRNVFQGMYKVSTQEGVLKLWSGVLPNTLRAQLMTASQFATYDEVKEALLRTGYFRDNPLCHLAASSISGFVATLICNPVDVVKTRLMKGGGLYSGAVDCARQIIRSEGAGGFYKGFVPALTRLGPNTVILLMCYEQYERLAKLIRARLA